MVQQQYQHPPSALHPPRDSLELASLASSDHNDRPDHDSAPSSPSGPPSSRKLSFSSSNNDPEDPQRSRPNTRTYSISSAFDFNPTLFPLSSSAPGGGTTTGGGTAGYTPLGGTADGSGVAGGPDHSLEKNKSLTYLNGLSLVIGLIIGSGIFSSPASVTSNAGSPAASLIIWLISGLLAWTGAASYAELGGAIPLNGGPQVYLAKIFGEWAGFLFTWCAVTVLKPGSAAIIAIIFGEYIVRAFGGTVGDEAGSGQWVHKGVAVLGLLVVTGLNCVSTKLGARTSDLFMFLKFVGLLAITGLGIVVAVTRWSYDTEGLATAWRHTNWFEGTSTSTSQWAVALYAGLWAFDGWDNTNYVVGEMKRPGKDLPRVIHTSLAMVIIAYLLANLAYVFVLPTDIINSSNTVAVAFGQTVLGPIGSLVLALVVSGSCFGALNATTFTAGRLIYSAGRENYIPSLFGSIGLTSSSSSTHHHQPSRLSSSRHSGLTSRLLSLIADSPPNHHRHPSAATAPGSFFATPIPALLLNLTLTSFYIALGDFTTLTTFYGVASYLFYFASVLGLLILRVKEPDLPRPYKCWIFTPVVFCCFF
ncbi:amino acid transporter [Hortaea werneckii]|nr:amino acid transporter [Hortaea werneckii]KAI6995846.1 amino acid transporter [Hortaea werneckii]KAI7032022.1 amino acid transporter [Hortaea werneckii]KAI7047917.1 amino acid transporter [Hortaea werneckii]KAI7078541.1 amino acid transporter [Hortaea werneckii]